MPPPLSIRLVSFDALYTLLRPRNPIHIQYAITFAPYFGTLHPTAVKHAFKQALNQTQSSRPSYAQGHRSWWASVIHKCAINAGAPPSLVEKHLEEVTDKLLHRFSSDEGYVLYPDVIPTLTKLKSLGIQAGVITNADNRMQKVLTSLNVTPHLAFTLTSEEEGIEKPDERIFRRACVSVGASVGVGASAPSFSPLIFSPPSLSPSPSLSLSEEREEREKRERKMQILVLRPEEVLHVGDELVCDYEGALNAGMHALLLRRAPIDDGAPMQRFWEEWERERERGRGRERERQRGRQQGLELGMGTSEGSNVDVDGLRVIGSLEELIPYVCSCS